MGLKREKKKKKKKVWEVKVKNLATVHGIMGKALKSENRECFTATH